MRSLRVWFQFQVRSIIRWLLLPCLCVVMSLTGCASASDKTAIAPTPSSSVIRIGTTAAIVTLDPADAYDQASNVAIFNLGDTLYRYKANSTELEPNLARALPSISADGLTYTIPLRQGVKFHDGTAFNAEAMAFSLRRFIKNQGRAAFLLEEIVQSIDVTGTDEITLKLAYPFAAFTDLLTYPGLCAISPQAYKIGEGQFKPTEFVGTGAYKLARYSSDKLELIAFDQYWGEKPLNQGVILQRFSSAANLYNAFRSSAIDVAYQTLNPDQIRSLIQLEKTENWQTISIDSPVISYLIINTQQPPFDRQAVRQVLAAAIDRDLINDRVFYGQAQPLYSLIPPSFSVSEPVFAERYATKSSPETVQQQLKSLGFSREKPLTLEVWYGSNSPTNRLAAIVLQAAADRDLGGLLKFEPHSVEAATAYGYLDKGVYPSFLLSWYADFFDPDNYLKPFLDCEEGSIKTGCLAGESQYHGSFFYSDRANQLLAQQRTESNLPKRAKMLQELQAIVAEEVPYLPLWQRKDYAFA